MKDILFYLVVIAYVTAGYGENSAPGIGSMDIPSMKLLKKLYEESPDKNVIISPIGVFTLLSLYASGSEKQSRDEVMQLLGFNDFTQLSDCYSGLSEMFSYMDQKYIILANKVFVSDKYTINDGFSYTTSLYKSEVDKINFENQTAAAEAINKWSSEKTNGIINEPVSASDIDADTAVALLNVIFLKDKWYVPFSVANTKDQDFYVDRSTVVKRPMMHLKHPLYYYDDKNMGAKMVILPYKETGFRMVIVLPNEVDGLPQVLEKFSETRLMDSVNKMRPQGVKVDLYMPKFEVKTKIDLNVILPKLGVTSIFGQGSSGVVKERTVSVSKALQQTFIKVNEEGSTAGAFTGFLLMPTSLENPKPEPIPFKADHPFLYVILQNDFVLFAGTYTH
ncbi:antichymotrypsin-1-like [Melitaea cinxia]|uniref:antichymotrypsin-1-like n=1 Tax=Melitaea cinxia TaxID=113334 RepID=UPI001E270A8F|nr:antichymotrypsin-1-like [Melitaea cinxia]